MKKTLIIAAIAAFAPLAAAPAIAQDAAIETAPATAAETVVAEVNGLVCDFCAQALNKVFKKTGAVESVDVDLDEGLVMINMKQGQTLPDDEIEKLITKGGYSFISMERTGGA